MEQLKNTRFRAKRWDRNYEFTEGRLSLRDYKTLEPASSFPNHNGYVVCIEKDDGFFDIVVPDSIEIIPNPIQQTLQEEFEKEKLKREVAEAEAKEEKREIITKEHEDFKMLMCAIDKELSVRGCDHKHSNFYIACKKLEEFRGYTIDRVKTLQYLESKGGYCDCEIMMNAQFCLAMIKK